MQGCVATYDQSNERYHELFNVLFYVVKYRYENQNSCKYVVLY